mmetsp:Transcript_57906/g.130557  ORF Transcript_57906/g.130557 Transcript_57906/m.130557 type:complete len:238 (+) Transcript_57906:748-1461(+)
MEPLQEQEGVEALVDGPHVCREIAEQRTLVVHVDVGLPVDHPGVKVLQVRHYEVKEVGLCGVVHNRLEDVVAHGEVGVVEGVIEHHEQAQAQLGLLLLTAAEELTQALGGGIQVLLVIEHLQHAENKGEETLHLLHSLLAAVLRNGHKQVLAVVNEEVQDRPIVVLPAVLLVAVDGLKLLRKGFLRGLALLLSDHALQPLGALNGGVVLALAVVDVGRHGWSGIAAVLARLSWSPCP